MANLKYDVDRKLYTELKGKIVAPKFQRNFIWKKKARKDLIDSIKNGLPIGSFLLQKSQNGYYNVIDGRQRFSTLLDYENHRYEYIDEKDISEEAIFNLFQSINGVKNYFNNYNDVAKKDIIEKFKKIAVKQLKTKDANQSDVVFELASSIKNIFGNNLSKDDEKSLYGQVSKFYDSIWKILDTSNIVLPCIIFNENATDDEIVNTFINLNSRGTKLSKYDLYAAAWQNDVITIDDNEIIDKVISKYKDSLESNQNIDTNNFDEIEIRKTKKINVFEYAYALSKLIGEKCNNKIFQAKEAWEVDSLGFSILANILNVSVKDMSKLSGKLVNSRINCADLKNKIVYCAKEIQRALEWYCTSPDNKNLFTHSINQLVSYIATYFKAKFEITSDGRIIDNAKRNKLSDFTSYLPLWYLYDNIRGYWAGSGDAKLDSMVLLDNIFDSRYFTKVSEDAFRLAILNWIDEENQEKSTQIKPEVKLFINYIIKKKCTEPHKGMDFDHIIPQARLEMLQTRERGILGISSPANLTLIPMFDNRSKREKTYYELIDTKDQTALTYNKEYLQKYLYPEHSEIKFIESQSEFTGANFNQFKKNRTNTLANEFINLYYKK